MSTNNIEALVLDCVENMSDCFAIFAAIRDKTGGIIDFKVEYVNKAACDANQLTSEQQVGKRLLEDRFLTLLVCCIYKDNLKMEFCNAGHHYPVIERNGTLLYLDAGHRFIFSNQEDICYHSHEIQLNEKDSLLLYTDGLIEWKGNKGFFGLARFKEYLKENGISVGSMQGLLQKSTELHQNMDDVTYLLIGVNDSIVKCKFTNTISSERENICVLTEWFCNIIDNEIGKGKFSSRIKQCFDELAVNAFEHGNKFNIEKSITVNVVITMDTIDISIEDQGDGFDPDTDMENESTGSDRGRGILIVKHYADEIKYNEEGNKVNIRFLKEGKVYGN